MNENYPELRDRIQSSFIDMLLVILLMVIFSRVLDSFENVPDGLKIFLFIALFVLYEPVAMCLGCTAGNYFKGIRVRNNADSNNRINLLQSLIRYPIKLFLGWISFLTIGRDPKRRAIHDIVAGSVMIKK